MADEAQVRGSINIAKDDATGYIQYQSKPTAFTVTVTGAKGPTPGAIAVTTGGVIIDLSALTTPGLCIIKNLDDTNYVEYGIWDGTTFWPLGEIGPKEAWPLKLSRNIDLSVGTAYGSLRLRANIATCNCSIEAFEK